MATNLSRLTNWFRSSTPRCKRSRRTRRRRCGSPKQRAALLIRRRQRWLRALTQMCVGLVSTSFCAVSSDMVGRALECQRKVSKYVRILHASGLDSKCSVCIVSVLTRLMLHLCESASCCTLIHISTFQQTCASVKSHAPLYPLDAPQIKSFEYLDRRYG